MHLSAMPEPGVPGAAFVRGVAPRDRMVRAHRAAVVAVLVAGRHHMHARPRTAAVVVKLVGDAPLAPVRCDAGVGERVIERASCRERRSPYVSSQVVSASVKKKT